MKDERDEADRRHHARIAEFDLAEHEGFISEYAELYRTIFNAPPWNEGMCCPEFRDEHPVFTFEDAPETCSVCRAKLVEYWPRPRVRSDFRELVGNTNCVIHWLFCGEALIGFNVGIVMTPAELEEHVELPGLAGAFAALGLGPDDRRVGYLKDVAVHPDFRRQGLAVQLFWPRLRFLRHRECTVMAARTMSKQGSESASFLWFRDWGFRVIARYPDCPRERVVQAIETEALQASEKGEAA